MKNIFLAAQMLLSIALIGLILIQAKGTGLGSAFGGFSGLYSTKRGVEKTIFYITIGVAVLFFASSVVQLLLV